MDATVLIVRVLDGPDRHRGFHYFVMDYVPGGDLSGAVSSGTVTVDAALHAVLEIGTALTFAHQHELIHRDVKPENILLDAHGKACLTDFDLVWAADSTGGTGGGALGTLLYAAPEVMLDASQVDQRADVYSLAMTTLFVLHGQKLTDAAVYERDLFFAELKCSEALRELVRQGTRRKPENRPATVAAFCDELKRICATEDLKLPGPQVSMAKGSLQNERSTAAESITLEHPSPYPGPQIPRFITLAGLIAAAALLTTVGVLIYWKREAGKMDRAIQAETKLRREGERMLRLEQGQRAQAAMDLLLYKAQEENLLKVQSDIQRKYKPAKIYLDLTALAETREYVAALKLCPQISPSSPWQALAREVCNGLIDESLGTARQARRKGRCLEFHALQNALLDYAPNNKKVARIKDLLCVEKSRAGKEPSIDPRTALTSPAVKPPAK